MITCGEAWASRLNHHQPQPEVRLHSSPSLAFLTHRPWRSTAQSSQCRTRPGRPAACVPRSALGEQRRALSSGCSKVDEPGRMTLAQGDATHLALTTSWDTMLVAGKRSSCGPQALEQGGIPSHHDGGQRKGREAALTWLWPAPAGRRESWCR
jgi:hypothetical protein